jgi:hypothetical protein
VWSMLASVLVTNAVAMAGDNGVGVVIIRAI